MTTKRTMNVDIRGDNRNLKRSLKDSEGAMGNFGRSVSKIGGMLAGAFAAGAVIGGIRKLITEIATASDRLLDLSDITGMSTTKLQEYEYVAKIAGVSTEAVASAAQGLTQRLARATSEASPLNMALKELGINTREANGELRSTDKVMDEVITQLANMTNQTERNVKGAQIFGGAWRDMAPILAKGGDEIERLRKEAHELGAVMDESSIKKANEFRESMVRMNTATGALGRELALILYPALIKVAEGLTSVLVKTRTVMGGLGDVAKSDSLSWWQKFTTIFGVALGDPFGNSMIKMTAEMAKAEMKSRELADSQVELSEALNQAEAAAMAATAAENERRTALGKIGRIEEDLAATRAAFVAAETDAERIRHQQRINNLTTELDKLKEIAEQGSVDAFLAGRGMSGMGGVSTIGGPSTPTLSTPGLPGMEPQDIEARNMAWQEHIKQLMEVVNQYTELQHIVEDSAYSMGASLMQMAQDGKSTTSQIIQQALAATMAQLIKWAATQVPFPASIAAMAAAGAAGQSAFGSLPAFADGGMVSGPTVGLMGEYANARNNPEVIAPLDKLKDMIGGGGVAEFKIRGDVLYAIMQKHSNRRTNNA